MKTVKKSTEKLLGIGYGFFHDWKIEDIKDLNTKYSKEFKKILKENNGGKYLGYYVENSLTSVQLIGTKRKLQLSIFKDKITIMADTIFFKA